MKLIKHLLILSLVLVGMFSCSDDDIEVVSKVSFKEATITASEGDEKVRVPITVSSPLRSDTWIYVSIIEDSEVGGKDGINYRMPLYIWLGPESVRGFVDIPIIDDPYPNEDRTFEIEITKVTGAAIQGEVLQQCTVIIEDDDAKKNVTVGFEKPAIDVKEDVGVFDLPVVLDGLLSDYLSVTVFAESGTAVEGVDFEILESKIKVHQGESWGVIPIKILDKQASVESRDFSVVIRDAEGVSPEDTTVRVSEDVFTCKLNIVKVTREVRFPEVEVIVDEMTKPFQFPVVLTAPVTQDVKVRLVAQPGATAIEGENYTIDKKELTIKRGETQATATISPINDWLGNPDRIVDFEIEVLTAGIDLSEDFKTARLIIENDDASIGFGAPIVSTWMHGTATVPIILEGLKDDRYLVSIKAKDNALVQENVHYMILTKSLEVGGGDSVVYAKVAVLNSALKSFNLPLEIAAIKGLDIGSNAIADPNKKAVTVEVLPAPTPLDKSAWTIDSFNTPFEPSNDQHPRKIIDGDRTTQWHTQWRTGNPHGPHIIVIDMQEEQSIGEVEIFLAAWTRTIKVEIGDKETWHSMGTMTFSGTSSEQTQILKSSEVVKGRYMRLDIWGRDAQGQTATIREVYAKGASM